MPQIQSGFLLTVSTAREGQQKYTDTKLISVLNTTIAIHLIGFAKDRDNRLMIETFNTKRLATVNQTKPDQKLQFIQEKESVQWF